jgi:hypothetical protein
MFDLPLPFPRPLFLPHHPRSLGRRSGPTPRKSGVRCACRSKRLTRPSSPFLPAFYKQAGIAKIWESAQSAIQPQLGRLQEPVANALLHGNGYLRNPKAGNLGRRFTVFVDATLFPAALSCITRNASS